MSEILIAIVMWCQSDPYPYKTFIQCRQQLTQCVKEARKWSTCFEQPEDLKWPNWEKTR